MLKLNEQQLARLHELEQLQYVEEVRKLVVEQHPELAEDERLSERMERAYRDGGDMGIDGDTMTQFLYIEALAPGFYREPAVHAWLTKPGRSAEERFADVLCATKNITKKG